MKSLLLPKGQQRKNLTFAEKSTLLPEEIDGFKKFQHLLKTVELGEATRKTEEEVAI